MNEDCRRLHNNGMITPLSALMGEFADTTKQTFVSINNLNSLLIEKCEDAKYAHKSVAEDIKKVDRAWNRVLNYIPIVIFC
jgi:hypothetical protein